MAAAERTRTVADLDRLPDPDRNGDGDREGGATAPLGTARCVWASDGWALVYVGSSSLGDLDIVASPLGSRETCGSQKSGRGDYFVC